MKYTPGDILQFIKCISLRDISLCSKGRDKGNLWM
jgi:hypothetical protein